MIIKIFLIISFLLPSFSFAAPLPESLVNIHPVFYYGDGGPSIFNYDTNENIIVGPPGNYTYTTEFSSSPPITELISSTDIVESINSFILITEVVEPSSGVFKLTGVKFDSITYDSNTDLYSMTYHNSLYNYEMTNLPQTLSYYYWDQTTSSLLKGGYISDAEFTTYEFDATPKNVIQSFFESSAINSSLETLKENAGILLLIVITISGLYLARNKITSAIR